MKTAPHPLRVTAMMRLTKISFTRIIPEYILSGINLAYDPRTISNQPVLKMKVLVSESDGSPYAVAFRMNGYTLGLYTHPQIGSGGLATDFPFSPEVVAYLSHAADEALAIVAPIALSH